jgi:D-beta-D-heptose 7-phosphate kinase/D-beta-D-heptose 1-phosphate adenosyltransferase
MLDVQIIGSISKMANEAPLPVLLHETEKRVLGGCGNVLMNLLSLGCNKLFLMSMIGNDRSGQEIQDIISGYSEVIPKLYVDDTYCTILKTRGISNKKIIFRYDVEKKQRLLDAHIEDCKRRIDAILSSTHIDAIVMSDYNKGFMQKELISYIISTANKHGVSTFVDPKVDYTKYIGCTLFKPNIKELWDIFQIHYAYDNLKGIHMKVKEMLKCQSTMLTLSEQGISLLTGEDELIHENTLPTDVYDVTGAGDVVLSIFAYYYKHIDIHSLVRLATWLGTHSVKYIGAYVIQKSHILLAYKSIRKTKRITAGELTKIDTTLVITNGCFDILHEGHIRLFNYCKSLGGAVVVALNGDDSIKRLKGVSRPINDINARIAMLDAIESIDWVVVFHEDTPYELYDMLRPDTIVKGGDYRAEDVIGKEFCKKVMIFNYLEGKSTTNIIRRIVDVST